ncbi:MAG TPA: NAD(P)/FAD-dependent oxidoreductase [Clostridia bacterium]|nr:NAD(P)/FAD-dependent oxidoreductase [Clostridia bacterium]
MKIAIVGGGMTGLSAAYFLSRQHSVTLFEREETLGGLASCFQAGGWQWPLERYFHHFFTSDRQLLRLVKELGIEKKLIFRKPKTSIFIDGQIFHFDSPQSILSFPKLGMADKIRLGLVSALLKINPFWQPLENITAISFIKKTMGEKVFALVWQPLFESKFGTFAEQIPASWFWTRIQKRSFALGYFEGGTEVLIRALAEKISKNGGRIVVGKEIKQVRKDNQKFEVFFNKQKWPENFDRVIFTTSPQSVLKLYPHLTEKEKKQLAKLKSLGSLCLVLALKKTFLTKGTYWLNINNQRFPFVAVVEHTNFISPKHYANQHLLYVGGYYPAKHHYFSLNKKEVLAEFLPYLKKIKAEFDFKQNLLGSWLFKDSYAQPIISLNYSKQILPVLLSTSGLYWTSLHHVYPQDRGVNYAIKLGKRLADEIKKS